MSNDCIMYCPYLLDHVFEIFMKPKILSGLFFLSIYKFTGGTVTIIIWQYHFQLSQQKYGKRHVSEL